MMIADPVRVGAALGVAIGLTESARAGRGDRLRVLRLRSAGQADLAEQAALLLRLGLRVGFFGSVSCRFFRILAAFDRRRSVLECLR